MPRAMFRRSRPEKLIYPGRPATQRCIAVMDRSKRLILDGEAKPRLASPALNKAWMAFGR